MSGGTDWENQRTFLAVLETGSLSGAARRLGIAQPTVRRRIEELETALAMPLFTRSANGLVATEQARTLAAHVRTMARAADAFVRAAEARPGVVGGAVRVTVPEFVGLHLLPDMLAPLRRSHPELRIEIALSDASADLVEQEADVAVRMFRPTQEALVARRVGTIPLQFFAHRAYVDRRGLPMQVDDLRHHDLIGPDRAAADLAVLTALGPGFARGSLALRTDSHAAQYAAIHAGLGIGVVQRPLGRRCSDLVAVLPDLVVHRLETWIVAHADLRRVPQIAATFDHLVAAFSHYTGENSGPPGLADGHRCASGIDPSSL